MIEFSKTKGEVVSQAVLDEIYEKIKTPYKYGAVLKFDDEMCDSPGVYFYNGKWYMSYIKISYDTANSGYDSHIAVSDDLVNWEYVMTNMKRSTDKTWDCNQIAGYPAFIENDFYGQFRPQQVNGKYYFAYLGGSLTGYETDPLSMGMCKCSELLDVTTYEKMPLPIMTPSDDDAREGERLSLFKSNMFIDTQETLGYKYVNVYNARGSAKRETIFLAVSSDGEKWERYGSSPVLIDDSPNQDQIILGDPQIIKIGNVYVMLYFILQKGKAFNTFACSYDLVNWTKWQGKNLIECEYEWEDKFAHKPWLVVKDGVVYHYYCAVNTKGERFIALATSKKI